MGTVAGIGIGLFILAFIWVLSLFLCVTLSRAKGAAGNAGAGIIVFAILLTVILWFFPRGEDTGEPDYTIYDNNFIGRTVLVSISGFMVLVGLILIGLTHGFEPQQAAALGKMSKSSR